MSEILGEEADIGVCEACNDTKELELGVCCEGCGGFYCRGICWVSHWCGKLTEYNGREIRVGDLLQYRDNRKHTYEAVEITPTFTRGQTCIGSRSLKRGGNDGRRYVMYTRLMEIIRL